MYNIRNSYITDVPGDKSYMVFYEYEDFCDTMEEMGVDTCWVRTPMTCHHHTNRGCCPICAGEIPDGVHNIGAFATLMITEVATQAALSSMNKGRKTNINNLLGQNAEGVKSLEDFHKWANNILDDLSSASVERRYYEIALCGRLFYDKKTKKVRVSSMANPNTGNYLGEFIYRPKETSFRNMVSAGSFMDNSLKTQIAFNSYKRGTY